MLRIGLFAFLLLAACTKQAGNLTVVSSKESIEVTIAVDPVEGGTSGGYTIVVLGKDFLPGTKLFVGGAPCLTQEIVSPTEMGCQMSAHAAGPVEIKLTTSQGLSFTFPKAFTYSSERFSQVELIAGSFDESVSSYLKLDAIGTQARFSAIRGGATGNGAIYVADMGSHSVRTIAMANTQVSTVTGGGNLPEIKDGELSTADFSSPHSIAYDEDTKRFYVAELHNVIRRVDPQTGTVDTLVTPDQGLSQPFGLAVVEGYLYVADSGNHVIRSVDLRTQKVSVFAGTLASRGSKDGSASEAKFGYPHGLVADPNGRFLYVADYANHTIRKVDISSGQVTTLAGNAAAPGTTDGQKSAKFYFPHALATDGKRLYVTDEHSCSVRNVDVLNGTVSTLAGGKSGCKEVDGALPIASLAKASGIVLSADQLFLLGQNGVRRIR